MRTGNPLVVLFSFLQHSSAKGFSWWLSGKESTCSVQEIWVRPLVQKDPTCCGATKLVCHNYRACTLEPTCGNCWNRVPRLLNLRALDPTLCTREVISVRSTRTATKSSPHQPQLETSPNSKKDSAQPKKKNPSAEWTKGWSGHSMDLFITPFMGKPPFGLIVSGCRHKPVSIRCSI